jgi:hypothetical protein
MFFEEKAFLPDVVGCACNPSCSGGIGRRTAVQASLGNKCKTLSVKQHQQN